ncbi:MAG: hypothetical protein UDK34_01530 [Cyanobacteriota bacterium]|nr:hypothetical protein [Cyanobacteriota bacterium]
MKKYLFELMLVVILVSIGLLQPCKYSFECHKSKGICVVDNRNIIGISEHKKTLKLSDIKDIKVDKHIEKRIRGGKYNRHTESVECYDLNFIMKNGKIIENALNNCTTFDIIAFERAEEISKFLNSSNIKDYEINEDYSLLAFIWFAVAGIIALCLFLKHKQEK